MGWTRGMAARLVVLDEAYRAQGALPEAELREYRQLDMAINGPSGLLPVRGGWERPTVHELAVWGAGSVN